MRFVEQRLGEDAAEAEAAKRRPHVEPLHLARVAVLGVGERSHRAAAGELAADVGEQQMTARRRVLARQRRQLGVEVLEAEVDVEARRVLAKDLGGARELAGRRRLSQLDPRLRLSPLGRRTRHPSPFPVLLRHRDNNRKAKPGPALPDGAPGTLPSAAATAATPRRRAVRLARFR
jgi:hypothetical protein